MKKDLEQVLLTIVNEEQGTVRSFVAQEALKENYDTHLFFQTLDKLGCACGIIESLVEYRDIYWFFNEHYREISNTLLEYTDEDEGFYFKGHDLKNAIVWCAVEKVAKEMAINDLGLDI